jgi:hypothetical protein
MDFGRGSRWAEEFSVEIVFKGVGIAWKSSPLRAPVESKQVAHPRRRCGERGLALIEGACGRAHRPRCPTKREIEQSKREIHKLREVVFKYCERELAKMGQSEREGSKRVG